MTRITYVLHHNDPDGFGAAVAAYHKFSDAAKYIPVDYTLPTPELENGSDVYILDFSFKRAVLDQLVERMNSVLIIDHHQSAKKDLEGHPNAIFDMNKSGAGLAWDYFVGTERPPFINYIEDSDLWRFALPNSHIIKNYIFNLELTLDNFLKTFHRVTLNDMIVEGEIIQSVIDHAWEIAKDMVHIIKVDEFKMLAVNSCLYYNEFGEYLLQKNEKENLGCDFAGTYFRVNEQKMKFSTRSRRALVDVSEVCTRFGGGGHARAAGFELPYSKFDGEEIRSDV